MEITHRRLDVGKVTLHVAEAGPEGAPLVVFLHGFPELWWSWRHQLEALAGAGYRCVAPDLRGYNESEKPEGVAAYEIEELVGDVAGLVRALGYAKATVVGHDWGGIVAWYFAQLHPELLTRLAILNVPHPVTFQRSLRTLRQLAKSWYIFFFQLPAIPERAIAFLDYLPIRRGFAGAPADEVERYVAAARVPGAMRAGISYYRAIVRRTARRTLPHPRVIEAPVLVVWGDDDAFLGRELAEPPPEWVPEARVVHLPGVSHWVQNAAAPRVNALLAEFLDPPTGSHVG